MNEYRVDELARLAGTTVRNVRSYQERGLIAPPRRSGRVGLYSDTHLVRLRAVASLLERGYTLQNITEILAAAESGQGFTDLVGLAEVMTSPFDDELPVTIRLHELAEMFGADATDSTLLAEALALGVVVYETDDVFTVPSPRILQAGAELHRAGVPLSEVFAQSRELRHDVDRIAARLVALVADNVFGPYKDRLPPPEAVPDLARVVARLRPLAQMVVDAELARALERHATRELGATLARVIEHIRASEAAAG